MFKALAPTKILFFIAAAYAFGCYGNLKSFHRLIMAKMSYYRYLDRTFLESFVDSSSTKHKHFMQITHFDH